MILFWQTEKLMKLVLSCNLSLPFFTHVHFSVDETDNLLTMPQNRKMKELNKAGKYLQDNKVSQFKVKFSSEFVIEKTFVISHVYEKLICWILALTKHATMRYAMPNRAMDLDIPLGKCYTCTKFSANSFTWK